MIETSVLKRLVPLVIVLTLFVIPSNLSYASHQGNVITLDPSTTYQTITGWEATATIGHVDFPNDYHKWQDEVIELAANELGINRLRLAIRSGAENPRDYFGEYMNGGPRDKWADERYTIVNDDNDPDHINPSGFNFTELDSRIEEIVLPLRQKVEANGESLYINLNYTDFESSNFEHHDHPDEYAEFILATFLHMQNKYGFVPDAVEVILEPDNSHGWKNGQGFFVGKALVAAGKRLESEGFNPDFIAPSTEKADNALPYLAEALLVPGISQYITEISYHRYGKRPKDTLLKAMSIFASVMNANTSMLERIGATYEDLHKDLKFANVSAWQQFTLAYPGKDAGGQYLVVDTKNSNNPHVDVGDKAKYLQQYFKYIRGGAVRIHAESTEKKLDPLAFINPNGTYVVVVLADKERSFSIDGLPEGTYGITYTTKKEYKASGGETTIGAGESLTAEIPEKGVITIFGKPQIVAPPPSPSQDSDDYNTNDDGSEDVARGPMADFSVIMKASSDSVKAGEELAYTIKVTNNGPKSSRAVVVNRVPASVDFVSATSDGGRCDLISARRLQCRLSKLKVGESAIIEMVVIPTADKMLHNAIKVQGQRHDPEARNNMAIQKTNVMP